MQFRAGQLGRDEGEVSEGVVELGGGEEGEVVVGEGEAGGFGGDGEFEGERAAEEGVVGEAEVELRCWPNRL